MEIVNSHCAGLDVHKKTVVVCRLYPDEQGHVVKDIATFDTMTDSLEAMKGWLKAVGIRSIAMESTGVYWKPIYAILEEAFEIVVVNAAHMKAVPGRKTDVKDAEWIADLLRHGLLKGSFIPPQAQRDVRELTRLRASVTAERGPAVNRLQKILEPANIKLAAVVSDITGLSARAMLNELIAGQTDAALLAQLAQGRLRDKTELLERALQGRVRDVHRFLLTDALSQLDYYDERIERISQEIDRLLHPFDASIDHLDTIPGVGRLVAQTILAEIGSDMSRFPSAQHLASWAGLAPANNVSAGKRLPAHIRKGAPALNRSLVQAAHAAIRTKNTCLAARFRRLAARRGKKRAIIAIAHTILVAAYYIIRDDVPYRERGADYFDQLHRERTIRQLTRRLNNLGLTVSLSAVSNAA